MPHFSLMFYLLDTIDVYVKFNRMLEPITWLKFYEFWRSSIRPEVSKFEGRRTVHLCSGRYDKLSRLKLLLTADSFCIFFKLLELDCIYFLYSLLLGIWVTFMLVLPSSSYSSFGESTFTTDCLIKLLVGELSRGW